MRAQRMVESMSDVTEPCDSTECQAPADGVCDRMAPWFHLCSHALEHSLRRCHDGEEPAMVMMELVANAAE